jgi:MFS transporter, FHS family, glucose/mannose:H+ symporter
VIRLSTKLITAGCFLSFFVFGFVDNLKGPLLPELLRNGEVSYRQAGTIVLAGYLGFILASLLTGVMADLVNNRSVLLFAAICLCIGSIGFGTTHSYLGLIGFMGITGVGLGAIELGANGLIVELHSESRGQYLNLLSTFHGFGSLLVPLYAGWLINAGFPWQQIYASSVLLAVPLLIVFWPRQGSFSAVVIRQEQPIDISQEQEQEQRSSYWRTLYRVGLTWRMICFYVLIAAYVAMELSVGAWMMEYLQQERNMSVSTSSFYLSSFFVLLMLGRLLGAFVVERVDTLLAVFIAILSSSICVLLGIFGNDSLVVLLPVSGFFMSIVFPTVTAAVTKLHVAKTGTILGILFAFGGLGGAIGPWTVGFVSDLMGLKIGLASSLAFSVIALGALLSLTRLRHCCINDRRQ